MTKILLIEDELALQRAIAEGLRSLDFTVVTASDGKEALDLFFDTTFDLILLDLNLPHIDGLELLRIFREDSLDIKIIILSARSEVDDKVLGLNLGSNDYLAKPFDFNELIARINNLLRRDFIQQTAIVSYKEFQLDTTSKTLLYDDQAITLTNIEFSILYTLFQKQNRIVPTEELITAVWDEDIEHDTLNNTLKVHINKLRSKLPRSLIHNKWGVGYYVE